MNHPEYGERIAFRSTQRQGPFAPKPRWTELAVYHNPASPTPFTAETKGCSSIEGERERVTRLASASLERALQHFVDGRGLSTPAQIVVEQARLWAETHAAPPARTYSEAQRNAARSAIFARYYNSAKSPVQIAPVTTGELVDVVAAALGLTREAPRG